MEQAEENDHSKHLKNVFAILCVCACQFAITRRSAAMTNEQPFLRYEKFIYLKKCSEDVGVAGGGEDEGRKGAEPAVEDRCAHCHQRLVGSS